MAKSFNPRVPKRGRARQVLKRPAHKKKGNWQQVPYVRDLEAQVPPRGDRHAWKRSLVDVVKCSVSSVVSMLRADNLYLDGKVLFVLIVGAALWGRYSRTLASPSTDATTGSA